MLVGVIRVVSINLVLVYSVRHLFLYSFKGPYNTYLRNFTCIKSVGIDSPTPEGGGGGGGGWVQRLGEVRYFIGPIFKITLERSDTFRCHFSKVLSTLGRVFLNYSPALGLIFKVFIHSWSQLFHLSSLRLSKWGIVLGIGCKI